MNTQTTSTIFLTALGLALSQPTTSRAQGPLTPPGAPAPTMKSLQELWDKIGVLETQNQTLAAQNQTLTTKLSSIEAAQNRQLYAQNLLPWTLTTVDSTGSVGEYTSIAFGPDGQPAISYYDDPSGNLKFARFNGNFWPDTTVDSTGFVDRETSLAYGPDGQPAISYYDQVNADLKFARFNGSAWTLTTVDSTGSVGRETSLAYGPDGLPAISYYDNTNGDLKFARMAPFSPTP
jgi:hypothetical protein